MRLVPFVTLTLLAATAQATTFNISPPGSCGGGEEFEDTANTLQPGDELVLAGGDYCQTARRFISVVGTAGQPIVIRAADGEVPVLTRLDDPTGPQSQNGIEIYGEHLVLRGLHFEHGDAGVRFMSGSHHVTLEDCDISQTSNNAITMNSGDTDSFIVRRNHIHHTGLLDEAHGTTEGEGMYVGCNNAGCLASNHLIEGNYIHDTRATSGGGNDGIELKYGSYGNIVRDNVIHTTVHGTQYPCILVYGVLDPNIDAPNIIEGNALWDCGEAIQVISDAVVRNNLILSSGSALTAASHAQVPNRRNVTIVNNTFYGHAGDLYIRWSGAANMVFANNAVYDTNFDVAGLGDAGVTVANNYTNGSGVTLDDVGFFDGGTTAAAFVGATTRDFWPEVGSPLIGNADAGYAPPLDFNNDPRSSPFDIGAYESEGLSSNPGWTVQPGFKQTTPDTTAPAPPTGLSIN